MPGGRRDISTIISTARPTAGGVGARGWRRAVDRAFATVPYYRELWSLTELGRPSPVADLDRRRPDLVPLRGGARDTPPARGLREAARLTGLVRRGTVLGILEPSAEYRRVGRRIWTVPAAAELPDAAESPDVAVRLVRAVRSGRGLAVVDPDVTSPGPLGDGAILRRYRIDQPAAAAEPGALLTHPLFGYLAGMATCGRWHLAGGETHVRPTRSGLAYTLTGQRSPRLVEVTFGPDAPTRIGHCPDHGVPVVEY